MAPAPYYRDVGIKNLRPRFLPLLGLALVTIVSGCDRGGHPTEIGRPAPDFTVSDGASTVHLAGYRGQVVLLNFWESNCAPCILELPSFLQFHHEHPEITIVSVSSDRDPDSYERFIHQRHVDFISVRDPDQTAGNKFSITGWPETFVIDRQGRIRRRFIGATDWNDPEILRYLKTL